MTTAQVDRFNGLTGARGVKDPCRAVSTGNLTLSGEQTVNGVACVADDRVLVKDQTDPIENGIYDVKTTAWVRSADFNGTKDIAVGTTVVAQGNYYSVVAAGTIGSGAITFTPGVAGGGAADIHAATNKTTPVGADEVGIWDSVTGLLNRVSFTNMLNWFAAKAGSTTQPFSASTINGATIKHYNDIINGQFRVAQVGTSFAAPASGAYDLDGWSYGLIGSSAVVTIGRAAGSSTGKLCRTVTVTTADAAQAAGDAVGHQTRIEGYNCVKYLGNTFTIGFRVKSSVTGTHCLNIRNGTSTYVAEYSITAANTWEYKTVTVTGGTPAIASSTNGYGLVIEWGNMCGSTYQTTAGSWNAGNFYGTANQVNDYAAINNVFALEDVTMNLGTVVAVDEISFDDELRRCQRYFRKSYSQSVAVPTNTSVGVVFSAGYTAVANLGYFGHVRFSEPMMAAPTVTVYSYTSSTASVVSSADAVDLTASSGIAALIGDDGFSIYNNSGGNITPATGGFVFHYTASARL